MAARSMGQIVRDALSVYSNKFQNEINFKLSSDDCVLVRSTPKDKNEVGQWLDEFSTIAGISYVVEKSYKETPTARKAFRCRYICQHSDKNKSVKSGSSKQVLHKHKATGCTQRLLVTIQRETRNVKRCEKKTGDNYVVRGLVATFSFNGQHNHQVATADAGRYLRTTVATENSITEKFKKGLGPAAALRELKEELQPNETANAAICPTSSHLYYTWDKFQKTEYGGRTNEDIFALLESKLKDYLDDGIKINFTREPFAVAIVTPIMERAAGFYSDSEVLFVDSTASCDVTNTVLTFLIIATPSGGLPIGAILTQSQSTRAYEAGFSLLKMMLGDHIFHPRGFPAITMTDDSAAEREAIANVWPQTHLLLCQFHVNQAVWRWLQQGKNVQAEHRQEIMTSFREVLYAETEENASNFYEKLSQLLISTGNNSEACQKYFDDWWRRRELWCSFSRQMPALRGHNTNNYAEATIRIFKDIGVNRVKQYNAVSLMHAVMTTMETFYQNRLLEFAHNRNRLHIFKLRCMMEKIAYLKKDSIIETTCKSVFQIPSEHSETIFEVNTELGICQCHVGRNGSFCKHLCAVAYHFNLEVPNAPKVSDDDRYLAAKVALGDGCPAKHFYTSLRNKSATGYEENEMEDTSANCSDPIELPFNRPLECNDGNSSRDSVVGKESLLQKLRETAALLESKVASLEDGDLLELDKGLDIYRRRLLNCNNASQLTTFLSTIGGGIPRLKRSGTMIGVQPTSKARRAENRSRGNRTLSYGRNAKAIQLLKIAKKCKASHNIGHNIRRNVSNYRKH